MADVVGLRDTRYVAPGQPNPTVVAKLEKWLAQAKRGEIDGIAAALSRPNNVTSIDYYLGPSEATFRVIAAVAMLQLDVTQEVLSRSSDGALDG